MDIIQYIQRMNQLYGTEPLAPWDKPEVPWDEAKAPARYNTMRLLTGGRVEMKPGGIVEPGVTHYGQLVQSGPGRQGYNGAEATALSFFNNHGSKVLFA